MFCLEKEMERQSDKPKLTLIKNQMTKTILTLKQDILKLKPKNENESGVPRKNIQHYSPTSLI